MKLHIRNAAMCLWRTNAIIFLAFFWLLGMIAGFVFVFKTFDPRYFSILLDSKTKVTSPDLVLTAILPLFLSLPALYAGSTYWILPLAFLKAFSFTYCSVGIIFTFSSAGWLVRLLLIFSNSCLLPPLLWLWFRHINNGKRQLFPDFLLCVLISFLISTIDLIYIVPVIQSL